MPLRDHDDHIRIVNYVVSICRSEVLLALYHRQLLERLRKALRFEVVPVITNFDPRFNNDKQLWFEKLFDPKNERYQPNKDQQ